MTDKERARYEDAKRAHAELIKVYPFHLENLDGELWANTGGDIYESDYQISTFGRVKSTKDGHERILKPFVDKDGYLNIAFSKNRHVKKFKIHRLVALAFIPNPNNKPQVNHVFGNKMDNYVDNLEWCTDVENNHHAITIGLRKSHKGTGRKLTDEQVAWCRKVHIPFDEEFGSTALAKKFGISQPRMSAILHRKTYKNAE